MTSEMEKRKIRKTAVCIAAFCAVTFSAAAQDALWSADSCMAFAVQHNHTVRQRRLEVDNYRMDRLRAVGSFLPGVSAGTGADYNFGRSVNPETNTYNNVSTFQNSYALQASLTLFRGGSLVNEVRRSRAALLMGKAALQQSQDDIALETLQAYIDVLYCHGTVRLAERKLADSDSLLYKTCRQEELGLKGMADVAQVRAQQAEDVYNLTCRRNDYHSALLVLKQKMNYPQSGPLQPDTLLLDADVAEDGKLSSAESAGAVFSQAVLVNPGLAQAAFNRRVTALQRKMAWADVLPSVSLSAGLSTSYYKELHKGGYPGFSSQFSNNLGRYFGVNVSIPLFGRLSGVAGIRKARNNYRIACVQYEAQREELRVLVERAVLDRESYFRQCVQMARKVEADRLAYHTVRRKFEEGLMTSLDVKTSAATLLESETLMLQSRLTYLLKCRLVDYYKGESLIRS